MMGNGSGAEGAAMISQGSSEVCEFGYEVVCRVMT